MVGCAGQLRRWWRLARSRSTNGRLVVYGWLYDTSNTANPQVLGKQYNEAASEDMARTMAHRFADEIIARLGGGINGIAETKIYFVSSRTGSKEDLGDGLRRAESAPDDALGDHRAFAAHFAGQSRLAFASLGREGWSIRMYSLELGRMVGFPAGAVGRREPVPGLERRWNARSRSRRHDRAIRRSGSCGCERRQARAGSLISADLTSRPHGIRRTNAQIAWVSGRTGLPQIYTMDQDGANIQRMTDGGYAVSPSWSPNGQFLTFSWNRKYGPGAPGGQDIYIMDIATKRWQQLTHDAGSNDFPSWAPDGRHIVFERQDRRTHADLVDAGRRHRSAPADALGEQFHAELELEVNPGNPEDTPAQRGDAEGVILLHYYFRFPNFTARCALWRRN